MGLFGHKHEKPERLDKYEYHSSGKAGRSGYGPLAIPAHSPPPYLPAAAAAATAGNPYFDVHGQIVPQGKMGKYGKYVGATNNLYAVDPMQQPMFLPPQSPSAMQAQAAAMLQMQQYMQGQLAPGQFAGFISPIQMGLAAAQQNAFVQPQIQPFFAYPAQQVPTPYFDPNNAPFQQQQQGAFAPYQQPNFYDSASAGLYATPYGYMPATF